MIDNKKLKTTLTTNFQLPKQVNQAKEEAFAKIKASKVSEAAKTEVSSTISSIYPSSIIQFCEKITSCSFSIAVTEVF